MAETDPSEQFLWSYNQRHPDGRVFSDPVISPEVGPRRLSSVEMDGFVRSMHALNSNNNRENDRFGLDASSGYNQEHQERISRIVGESGKHSSGFMGRMWHYVTTFFESVFKGFDFSNFSQRVKEKDAMPAAINAYENLVKHGYENIAEKVSGVRKTENGYEPILRENAEMHSTQSPYVGVFDLAIERADPKQLAHNDAADKAAIPSRAQIAMLDSPDPNINPYERIMKEIYERPEVHAEIARIRLEGKQHEAQFMAEKYTDEVIDLLSRDPDLGRAGKFNFAEYPRKLVYEHIFKDHQKHAGAVEKEIQQYTGNKVTSYQAPTEVMTAAVDQYKNKGYDHRAGNDHFDPSRPNIPGFQNNSTIEIT